jgi:ABC-type phosphate transport system substrate-binding protein
MDSATAKQLSDYFLKKKDTWPNDQPVRAVDLPADSPIREEFTRVIHGKKVSSIKSFWQRQIFQGKAVPPPEKADQVEVIAFVALNPGAIGYVAASSPVHENVKVLAVVE